MERKEKELIQLVHRVNANEQEREDFRNGAGMCLDKVADIIVESDDLKLEGVNVDAQELSVISAMAGIGYAWLFHREEFTTLFPATAPAASKLLLPSDN